MFLISLRTDIYPSTLEDWQPIDSIVGIFDAYHASIGEHLYKVRSGRSLAERGVFFYDKLYMAPQSVAAFGTLKPLPLPPLESPEWPLPIAETSECFRLKLYNDIQRCLRPNVASRQVKITLFMPLHVFVDFFYDEEVRKTLSMIICKSEKCMDFLDQSWDLKELHGVTCKVQHKSIICKYMIGSQNFILTFHYMRWHYVNGNLVAIDQDLEDDIENPLILLEVWIENELLTVLNIRANVSLRQIRMDLANEDDLTMPNNYLFKCNNSKVSCYCTYVSICLKTLRHAFFT
jgi:hypothetical protein